MTPTANSTLKAEYAAYCAEERARHFTPVSYELWLEGTLNACRLDLANAQKAVHLPDVYRAALEQLVSAIEPLRDAIDFRSVWHATANVGGAQGLIDALDAAIRQTYEALGGVDEVTVFINGSEKRAPVELSFEDIVVLAFDEGARELTPTVLYSRAFGGRSGVLIKGKSVRVTDGTRISVAFT